MRYCASYVGTLANGHRPRLHFIIFAPNFERATAIANARRAILESRVALDSQDESATLELECLEEEIDG